MNTPICDFVAKYVKNKTCRLHMPGHKGKSLLGFEKFDLTEIDGADCLYHADGIIKESQLNASKLFGCHTFYSTEGSSLCIRAMLYLALKLNAEKSARPYVLATRNVHKSFVSALGLLDLDVEWLYPKNDTSYLSCPITPNDLRDFLSKAKTLPIALFITSPDYLGNTLDISAISKVCKEFNLLCLVDNAHGAYLKFLEPSIHPIDLGADMCCDSAHKTLPALTGAGYLHISHSAPSFLVEYAQKALSLFASTSPSYLILQSLDMTNKYLANGYKDKLNKFIDKIDQLKRSLTNAGYVLRGNEKLKLTIDAKSYGYLASEINKILNANGFFVEFYDDDYIVMMFTLETDIKCINKLQKVLLSIPKKTKIDTISPSLKQPSVATAVKKALTSKTEIVSVDNAKGRIFADLSVSCPPAIPIAVCGEILDDNAIEMLKYYKITHCEVIKQD